jgi:hypothetical protein
LDDLCLLAVALINVKNYAEAADVLNQAQKLNPTDACPWWLRGCSCYIQKQYPEKAGDQLGCESTSAMARTCQGLWFSRSSFGRCNIESEGEIA